MGYIYSVDIDNTNSYLIEPLLFATAGGTSTALTADISNFTLTAGAYVNIKVGTVDANATLNVNNTGAEKIYYNNIRISAGMLTADHIYTFVYDGTNWTVLGDLAGSNVIVNTTAGWQSNYNYIAPRGMVLVYTDHGTVTETVNNEEITKTVPGVKIGDGSTPVIDLSFVGDDVIAQIRSELNTHINDNVRHITAAERTFWNNKINCNDTVNTNNLVLTRN